MRFGALSVGLSLIGQLYQSSFSTTNSTFRAGPTPLSPSIRTNASEVEDLSAELRAQLGAALTLGGLRLGVSAHSPGLYLAGQYKSLDQIVVADAEQGTKLQLFDRAGDSEAAGELFVRAGAAFQSEALTVSADASFEPSFFTETFRVALGAAVPLSDRFELRAGLFGVPLGEVERPSQDALDRAGAFLSGQLDIDNVDDAALSALDAIGTAETKEFGASLGLSYLRPGQQIDVAVSGVFASGNFIGLEDEIDAAGDLGTAVRDKPISGFGFFLSVGGTYGIGEDTEEDA